MPKEAVPDRYRDNLDSTAVGPLVTLGPYGRPQIARVRFLSEGRHV